MDLQTTIVNAAGEIITFTPTMAVDVVPHDTDIFQKGLLYIGVGGDIKVMPAGQTTFVTFKNVPDGTFFPMPVMAVHTDTTATDMLICY